MGLFDFLLRRRRGDSDRSNEPAMRPENPNWILVEGSTSETIRHAVIQYSGLTKSVQSSRHQARIYLLGESRYAVMFDPPVPAYSFTNLIAWLADPGMTRGARRAVGWLVAPVNGVRYFLAPQRTNPAGDTLVGVGSDGGRVSVYLPECSVKHSEDQVVAIAEHELPSSDTDPLSLFEITVDGDASFGNPQFVVS